MNGQVVKEFKAENGNGKTITLSDEICAKWGFTPKSEQVNKVGEDLSKNGFNVKITHSKSDTMSLFIVNAHVGDKTVLVFSNAAKDKADGVCVADYPKNCHEELVQAILALHK